MIFLCGVIVFIIGVSSENNGCLLPIIGVILMCIGG